jgi:hypothetical protein
MEIPTPVDECLDFVFSAGLVYYPHDPFAPPSGFRPAVNALPERRSGQ